MMSQKKPLAKILLVEDDPNSREGLEEFLRIEGYEVISAENLKIARSHMGKEDFDLFLIDLNLPDGTGLELAKEGLASDPELVTIIITAFGSVSTAVQAMKEGVFDYIQKPIADMDELLLVIDKGLERRWLKQENLSLKSELKDRYSFHKIVGASGSIQETLKKVERVSRTNSTVLIRGESGTGKELAARALHNNSPRKDRPFVTINCPSFPESLLESELFGHKRGSFTGAIKNKMGLFEMADTGSLFLDEIGELSLGMQAKLLRVLEQKTFIKVGAEKESSVDVRIIAATNRDLEASVKKGDFREDLYYRLSVVPIFLPPLRDRQEDIAALIEHFMDKLSREMELEPKIFNEAALEMLNAYSWPGNVRELQNLVESCLVIHQERLITEDMLPIRFIRDVESMKLIKSVKTDAVGLGLLMDEHEKQILHSVLEELKGSRQDVANHLGISLRTLQYKLKKHGLS